MTKKKKDDYFEGINKDIHNCKVEAIVSIDERGQMVLPKDLRKKANILSGDKLTIVSWEKEGKLAFISLIKAEDFSEIVNNLLGTMAREILSK